jgi:cell division protein FtsL
MAPATATAPAPQRPLRSAPAPEVEARPDLRVVDPVDEPSARRSFGGLVGTIAVVLLFVCIFGVVVFQVLLVQTQSHLDDLDRSMATEQARAKDLDLQMANLESPERIVDAAVGLGMIVPEDTEYLESVDGNDERAAYDPATEPVGTTQTTAPGTAPAATAGGAGGGTTATTVAGTGGGLPPGPPYTAENNWGAGGPTTLPPVYNAENNWGAGPNPAPTGGR